MKSDFMTKYSWRVDTNKDIEEIICNICTLQKEIELYKKRLMNEINFFKLENHISFMKCIIDEDIKMLEITKQDNQAMDMLCELLKSYKSNFDQALKILAD